MDAQCAMLAASLADEPLDAAWLFGSRATGAAGKLSDVDVGILPRAGLSADERWELRGRVMAHAERAYGVPRADVVLVDEAPPRLAFAAIRGDLLLDRQPERRCVLEARIMTLYHDRRHAEERWLRITKERLGRGEFA